MDDYTPSSVTEIQAEKLWAKYPARSSKGQKSAYEKFWARYEALLQKQTRPTTSNAAPQTKAKKVVSTSKKVKPQSFYPSTRVYLFRGVIFVIGFIAWLMITVNIIQSPLKIQEVGWAIIGLLGGLFVLLPGSFMFKMPFFSIDATGIYIKTHFFARKKYLSWQQVNAVSIRKYTKINNHLLTVKDTQGRGYWVDYYLSAHKHRQFLTALDQQAISVSSNSSRY
jgi:hypothetical protein